MHLYNVTLQPSVSASHALVGSFSGTPKQQEILVCRGGDTLELLRADTQSGKQNLLISQRVFGIVRSLATARLTGSPKDYIVVGSDSGRIVILEYDAQKNQFVKLHQETFGKSGCRRIIPGEYLAIDPKGRAIMIGAMEKQKIVYVLNRDSANRLTISSPLEAHKAHTLVECMCPVDVGYENPIFACLEYDYQEVDQDPSGEAFDKAQKMLTFYELDLGLNHVVRKWSDAVDMSSNLLISVPGGSEGPGGVLVCSEGWLTWKNQNYTDISLKIPRRRGSDQATLIVSHAVHKMKNGFFILAQTELGDLFKITIDWAEDVVRQLSIMYFDTIPVSRALGILKSGFLFSAPEFGNQYLYQIESLGDEEEEETAIFHSNTMDESVDSDTKFHFDLHILKHLAPVDETSNLCPVIDAKVMNLTDEDTPQIYALCGRSAQSSLRILRRGLEVNELVSYPLPGTPSAVWSVKKSAEDEFDAYIVISFLNATLVLSVGETVEEVTDSGFLTENTQTLDCQQMGAESVVQIYSAGVRHITNSGRISEWKAPNKSTILFSACNKRQVAVCLSNQQIVYFELDENTGRLVELEERPDLAGEVLCLAVGAVPKGRQRSRFLAVGLSDQTVRLFSLDPESRMTPVTMQALNSVPHSLLILDMMDLGSDQSHSTTYLNIGLENGVLLRNILDPVTGELSDTRTRYLGALPVKLRALKLNHSPAFLALSSRPWVGYSLQQRSMLMPMSYEALAFASGFQSEVCVEGVVAVVGDSLRIMSFDQLGNEFNTAAIPLTYTPRQMAVDPVSRNLIIIESDHGSVHASPSEFSDGPEGEEMRQKIEQFGREKAGRSQWASLIRVLSPFDGETRQLIHLDNNETAVCVASCVFHLDPSTPYFIVGTAKDLQLAPRKLTVGFLHLYRRAIDGSLVLIHKTEVENVPSALCPFQGRLLVGVGKLLRIYDLGKRKLLRKCETRTIPNYIVSIQTQGDRIIVGDIQESVHYARYLYQENLIVVFADDPRTRWLTRMAMLDYNTVASADKFGNFCINRLPSQIADQLEEDVTGSKLIHEKEYLNGAPYKIEGICEFFLGDIVTALQRSVMVAGGREVLLYVTLSGAIGMFVPFVSREDVEFFQMLELQMRNESVSLCGRDHLAYRSYYFPVKNVVDGNLIEQYHRLPADKKRQIAEELDRTVGDVSRQIELIRSRVF